MRGPHNIWRLIRTGATLERTGAMGVVLEAFEAPRALRIVARTLAWPFRWLGIKGDPNMPPVVRALTALGPAYIKFGQVLSTRPDVVGNEMASQLRVLQDKLPPFSIAEAKASVEAELGQPTDDLFLSFPIRSLRLQLPRFTRRGWRKPASWSLSKSCARALSAPFAKTWMPFTLPPLSSNSSPHFHAGCARQK